MGIETSMYLDRTIDLNYFLFLKKSITLVALNINALCIVFMVTYSGCKTETES